MVEEQENKEFSLIEEAKATAERIEKANKIHEELLKKQEAIESRLILGGKSNVEPIKEVVEESAKDYAARILRGGK